MHKNSSQSIFLLVLNWGFFIERLFSILDPLFNFLSLYIITLIDLFRIHLQEFIITNWLWCHRLILSNCETVWWVLWELDRVYIYELTFFRKPFRLIQLFAKCFLVALSQHSLSLIVDNLFRVWFNIIYFANWLEIYLISHSFFVLNIWKINTLSKNYLLFRTQISTHFRFIFVKNEGFMLLKDIN